jgi:alpha,alpha-trehalose phosphorylase
VAPGEQLHIVKYIGYGWSSQRSRPALIDQVVGALAAAHLTGWDGLLAEQRAYLDEFWEGADVEVDGDAEIQQAVRFGLFHILQAGRAGRVPADRGQGPDRDRLRRAHVLGHRERSCCRCSPTPIRPPRPTRCAGGTRCWTTPRQHATDLGLAGAAFPWRTIRGQECSGYWPAGTAAFHINADIADAVIRYLDATQDAAFETEVGLELLVETARLWRSLGQHDAMGRFRIEGVTGPDEYSAVKDNNVYTNLMAQRNLAAPRIWRPDARRRGRELGVTTEEAAAWRDAAAAMYIPFDERLGVHPQHEGFTDYARWDFKNTPEDHYPLLLHYPYFQLYRKQVVKQADLVLAMYMRSEAFTPSRRPQLRLLRAAHGAGLLAVGLHPGRDGRRGRPARPGPRLPGRGRADGPAGRRAQHLGRRAHGLPGRGVDGAGGGLRRDARGHRHPQLQPPPPERALRAEVPAALPGPEAEGHDRPDRAKYELIDGEPLALIHHGKEFKLGR